MRIAALVIGLIGSLVALVSVFLLGGTGTIGVVFHQHGSGVLLAMAISALGASILGLVGAILAVSKPRVAWVCLLVAAVWVVVSVSAFGVFGGFFLFVAAIFSFFAARTRTREPQGAAS